MNNSIENFIINLPTLVTEREKLLIYLKEHEFYKKSKSKTVVNLSRDVFFGPNLGFKKFEVWESLLFEFNIIVYIPYSEDIEKLHNKDLENLEKSIHLFNIADEKNKSKKLERLEERLEYLESFIEQSQIALEVSKYSESFGLHMYLEIEMTGAKIVNISFLKPKKDGELKKLFTNLISNFQCEFFPDLSYNYSTNSFKKSKDVISGIMPLTLQDAQKSEKMRQNKIDREQAIKQDKQLKLENILYPSILVISFLLFIWLVN